MAHLKTLLNSVASARLNFIQSAAGLTYEQSQFKISPNSWSITDIVEHMVWAELGGINGIWKTLEGINSNKPVWSGESPHHGLCIEEIIDKTWKEKEQAPENAKPKWGGSVGYWLAALQGCQSLLEALARELEGYDLEKIIYPHFISGALNVIQRFEFLRFHLDRHRLQIQKIRNHPEFPL